MTEIAIASARCRDATHWLVKAAKNYIKPEHLPRRLIEIVGLHYLVAALMFGAGLWQQTTPPAAADRGAAVHGVKRLPPLPAARSKTVARTPTASIPAARAIPPMPKRRPRDFSTKARSTTHFSADRATLLRAAFRSNNYDLSEILRRDAPVPILLLKSLPADWTTATRGASRKRLFVKVTLPLITEANAGILRDRRRLKAIAATGAPNADDGRWLQRLAERYKTDRDPDTLLEHVDIVPPSLALAQAALESGWGTSRFAHRGNALFGEWTWGSDDKMAPLQPRPGKAYGIRRFSSLLESVDAYMANINRLSAYKKFRTSRARLRRQGKIPSGSALAPTLTAYSVERDVYVAKIAAVISDNDLTLYDSLVATH
jgi:Bax protein